uniref:Uncharacterized protein n=1 Tax=Leersia perrieri TaxID=77586 RepID=A0A0D9VSH3_9ORYZ
MKATDPCHGRPSRGETVRVEEIARINTEPRPPRRDDLIYDEEFQLVVRDVIIGWDNVLFALGETWTDHDIFEGLEGLEFEDEMRMEVKKRRLH